MCSVVYVMFDAFPEAAYISFNVSLTSQNVVPINKTNKVYRVDNTSTDVAFIYMSFGHYL